MGEAKRFNIFREKHFGFGIRWQYSSYYEFDLSIAFPFFTIVIGVGKEAWK